MYSRYSNIPTTKSISNKTIYQQVYYPEIPTSEDDTYIIVGDQDRLDLIANDFWGDAELWWVLVMVNNLDGSSFFPPKGMQLRIPKDVSSLLNTFNKENE